jgi:hypothetical protein
MTVSTGANFLTRLPERSGSYQYSGDPVKSEEVVPLHTKEVLGVEEV